LEDEASQEGITCNVPIIIKQCKSYIKTGKGIGIRELQSHHPFIFLYVSSRATCLLNCQRYYSSVWLLVFRYMANIIFKKSVPYPYLFDYALVISIQVQLLKFTIQNTENTIV
jgi:hypothetical protein